MQWVKWSTTFICFKRIPSVPAIYSIFHLIWISVQTLGYKWTHQYLDNIIYFSTALENFEGFKIKLKKKLQPLYLNYVFIENEDD